MDEDDYIIIVKDNYNVPVIQKGISSTYRYVSNILVMYLLICLYINPATYMVISIMGHGPFLVAYIVLFKFLGML